MKIKISILLIVLSVLTLWVSKQEILIKNELIKLTTPLQINTFLNTISENNLTKENLKLKKQLLEYTHYTEQLKTLYNMLPHLSHLPINNINIVQTISYASLNSFSKIILTQPKEIKQNKIYGLLQNQVVAGIAFLKDTQLFGYLTSDNKCRFSVFIGKSKASGIAIGEGGDQMIVKFIPKWYQVSKGDRVTTSGLDNIFFANMPVGEVIKVETQSAYKIAYIKTYNDIYHPKTFFLINDASPTLTKNFNDSAIRLPCKCPKTVMQLIEEIEKIVNTEENKTAFIPIDKNITMVSSIPIEQTQENIIEPTLVIEENQSIENTPALIKPRKPKIIKHKSVKRKKRKKKHKRIQRTLDLF